MLNIENRVARTLLLLAVVASVLPASIRAQENTTIVYLVRHAEKADDDPRDPSLSKAGVARANTLADMLRDVALDGVLSTDYRRTRLTAEPIAARAGVSVETYDPRSLADFATEISTRSGHYVVVGHSNTTPELVELLGGDPGEPIAEDEYDRIYVVVLNADEDPITLLLRYGQ